MELAWSFQGFVVVLLIVATTSESFDCVDLTVIVTGSFTPEFITVAAAPVPPFSEVPIIIAVGIVTVKQPTIVTIIILLGRLVVLLASSDIFSNQFLHVICIDVIFGSSEELGDRARPLTK